MRHARSPRITRGVGVGAALGIMPFACMALAGYLWALTIRDFLTGWLGVRSEPA